MERLSIVFTNYIMKKGVIPKENYDIYLYGFQSFLELFLNFICSVIIAVVLHMEIECLLFFLFFIPLRSFNGGLHLESYYSCLVFSCMTMTTILFLVKYIHLSAPVSFILFLVLLTAIKLTGSYNHPNRPVDEEENQEFVRKTNLTFLLSFLAALGFLMLQWDRYLLLLALTYLLVFITLVISKFNRKTK
ncbi:accessory gene regulator B family protein [Lacrimispora xylanolytica]|uniref:Accessory gene regulator B family protein n=1 Tax=Lacrimispora xylanolytica TaxID=29375 RepID=A0ABY7ADV9_9FIRM|nr:accessory gene regulator B family protein [Lacrimispora xylanolytica]WAJ24909.1 accessory gene regulator B family protein [Lacrimispora xylanolytica]